MWEHLNERQKSVFARFAARYNQSHNTNLRDWEVYAVLDESRMATFEAVTHALAKTTASRSGGDTVAILDLVADILEIHGQTSGSEGRMQFRLGVRLANGAVETLSAATRDFKRENSGHVYLDGVLKRNTACVRQRRTKKNTRLQISWLDDKTSGDIDVDYRALGEGHNEPRNSDVRVIGPEQDDGHPISNYERHVLQYGPELTRWWAEQRFTALADNLARATLPKLHFIDVVQGKLAGETGVEDLARMMSAIEAQAKDRRLVLYFHGGLTSKRAAKERARMLLEPFQEAQAYPVFFIWNSDVLSAFAGAWPRVASAPCLQSAIGRLELETAKPGASPKDVIDALRRSEALAGAIEELVDACDEEPEPDPQDLEPVEFLAPRLLREEVREAGVSRESRREAAWAAVTHGMLDVLERAGARVAGNFDHGPRMTIVEEILREFLVAEAGEEVWRAIKRLARVSFHDGDEYAGSRFITEIGKLAGLQPPLLVGHSAGAVYIANFLDAADRILGEKNGLKFDVVFLAPAITLDRFARMLDRHEGNRLRDFRMFTMSDERERTASHAPALYPGSLLYLVSGIFEGDPRGDRPLLGMQRFLNEGQSGHSDDASVARARVFLRAHPGRQVFAPSLTGEGLRCDADNHDRFPLDGETIASIQHILRKGFA